MSICILELLVSNSKVQHYHLKCQEADVSFPPLLIRHQVCWKVCHSYMVIFLANDKLQVPISTNEIDGCWKRLLWRFPSLINILTQSSVSHCVVGIQTLAWKKWNYSHCVPGISFHLQMNMLFYEYERKKKKKGFPTVDSTVYVQWWCVRAGHCGGEASSCMEKTLSHTADVKRCSERGVELALTCTEAEIIYEMMCKLRCLVLGCCYKLPANAFIWLLNCPLKPGCVNRSL